MTKAKVRDPAAFEWELVKRKNGVQDCDKQAWEEERKGADFSPLQIGWRLRFERRMSDLTQVEVAGALGISESTIAAWEHGDNDISLKDAYRLMMLYRRIPGNRGEYEVANLNALTNSYLFG